MFWFCYEIKYKYNTTVPLSVVCWVLGWCLVTVLTPAISLTQSLLHIHQLETRLAEVGWLLEITASQLSCWYCWYVGTVGNVGTVTVGISVLHPPVSNISDHSLLSISPASQGN